MRTAVVVRLARCAVLATGAAIVAACSDGVLEPRATVRASEASPTPKVTAARQVGADSVVARTSDSSGTVMLAGPTVPWY
jgi:hypothetical protein